MTDPAMADTSEGKAKSAGSDSAARPKPDSPVVTLRGVAITLGGRRILEDLNADIQPGEFISVLGPNGAGKSTLLKMLLGLLKPDRGEIRVLGARPQRGNAAVGYVPQHRVLETDFTLRACDVVGFGLDGHKWGFGLPGGKRAAMIDQALTDVSALQFRNVPIGNLSGGEQQRLLIAQALISNPTILLLDEPFSNLDLNHEKEIIAQISFLTRRRGITVLLVSHDINPLLHVTDRVLFLSHGRGALGTPDEVINGPSLSRLYNAPVEVVRASGRIFVLGVEL